MPQGRPSGPNILILMSDEHAPHVTGAYGHPFIRTPGIDRLAREGVLFERAYCNSPLCVPSRASFLTGKQVHRIGVWDNGTPLASDEPTWAHSFALGGYEAVLDGKIHFVGPDQLHGFERRLSDDAFDGVGSELLAANPFGGAPLGARIHAPDWTRGISPVPQILDRIRNAGPGRAEHLEYDEEVQRQALRFLREWAAGSRRRPFVLCVGYNAPHFPLVVEQQYFDLYYPTLVDMPKIPSGHLARQHPVHQGLRRLFCTDQATADEVRRARAAYFGLITFADRMVGEIVDQVDRLGLRQDTLVIYCADHGEMMGEHGLWWKCNFFEEAVRVPLVVSFPGRLPEGRRVREIVSLIDLVPTLFALAGLPDSEDLDGDNLVPLMRGEPVAWKDTALSEYHAHGVVHSMRMIRTDRYKLNYVVDEQPELYDLEADPREFNDLARDPAYAQTVRELTARVLEGWDPRDIERRVRASQVRRQRIFRAEEARLRSPSAPANAGGDMLRNAPGTST